MLTIYKDILQVAEKQGDTESALKILRSLPFPDFAFFMMTINNHSGFHDKLPQMAPIAAQKRWTGKSGLDLLQTSIDFVKAINIFHYERGLRFNECENVLDFGFGWGRIIRLLYYYFDTNNLYGVDPLQDSLDICNEYNLKANLEKSEFLLKSLPFDRKFDLMYAFSVFTHLSDKSASNAMNVLRKSISKKGYLVATIRPVEYWDFAVKAQIINEDQRDKLKKEHRDKGYAFYLHESRPEDKGGATYGDSSFSLEYIEENWTDWKLDKIDRNISDPFQLVCFFSPK